VNLNSLNERKQFSGGKRGFSILEVVVGIGLFAISLFGLLSLISHSLSMNELSESRVAAINDARRVVEAIRREVEINDINGVVLVTDTPIASSTPGGWSTFLNAGLPNENVAVTLARPVVDPLALQVVVTWDEEGAGGVARQSSYAVSTAVTRRG
jgi:Tfp pilus assembly protein PilV